MSAKWLDVVALLAGALVPLGFAPFGLWLLPPIAVALLFGTWLHVSPGRAFRRGWLFGLGMFGIGVSWVQVSIHQFGLPWYLFSVSVTLAFVAFIALYPAITGYIACRFSRSRSGIRLLLTWPALWTLVEWLRGWLLTGFPWLNLGYSQIDSPLSGFAPVGGAYLVTWAVALTGGSLCYLARRPLSNSIWVVPVVLMLWGGGFVLRQVTWTEPLGQSWRVAIVQGNVQQSLKWDPAKRDATLALYRSLSEKHWGDQLIVWPETAIPAFPFDVRPFLEDMQKLAHDNSTTLLAGMPVVDADGRRYYNAIVSLGASVGEYRKRHLVPLGEYIPFSELIGGALGFLKIPMSQFSAGDEDQPLLRVGDTAVGLSICYEAAFGNEIIDTLPAAGLLVNVSNDAWFGDSLAPHQHLEIARMRSLETGRCMLRATNTGISAVIDAHGRILKQAPQFEQAVLETHVDIYAGSTPFALHGNTGVVAGTLLTLLAARARHLLLHRRDSALRATSETRL